MEGEVEEAIKGSRLKRKLNLLRKLQNWTREKAEKQTLLRQLQQLKLNLKTLLKSVESERYQIKVFSFTCLRNGRLNFTCVSYIIL